MENREKRDMRGKEREEKRKCTDGSREVSGKGKSKGRRVE